MSFTFGLFVVGFTIILGLFAQYIFKKTKMPDVLLLIIFGAVLSISGFTDGFEKNSEFLLFLVTFSLIYVVFYGALSIKLKAIFSTMKHAFFSSILNLIFITSAVGVIAKYLLGFDWVTALSLGALFAVIDGSIINGLLETLSLSEKSEAQVETESAIIDILVIVGVISILNFSHLTFHQIVQDMVRYIFLSFGIGLVAAIIWAFTIRHVGESNSTQIATMALLVMLYAFAEYVKANGVITIFSFSIILGNVGLWSRLLYNEEKQRVVGLDTQTKSFFKDISFIIRAFLFVYLGMLIDITYWPYLLIGFSFFVIAYLLRSFISRLMQNKELSPKDLYLIEAMCAKGLTPTVMIVIIAANPIFTNIMIGGIFSSVLITSIAVFLIDKGRFTSISHIFSKLFQLKKKQEKETIKDLKIKDSKDIKAKEIKEKVKEIKEKVKEIKDKEKEVKNKDKEVKEKEVKEKEKEKELKEKEREVKEKEKEVKEKEIKEKDKEKELKEKEKEVKEKEKEIKEKEETKK